MEIYTPPRKTLVNLYAARSSGVIAVTGAGVDIVTGPTVAVIVGDVVHACATLQATKGATAGDTQFLIALPAAYTCSINWQGLSNPDPLSYQNLFAVPIGGVLRQSIAAMGIVTVAGNLALKARGTSSGSDYTVADQSCGIAYTVFRGPTQ